MLNDLDSCLDAWPRVEGVTPTPDAATSSPRRGHRLGVSVPGLGSPR